MNVGSLQPTLLAILSQLHGIQISKGVYKGKSSCSFNRLNSLHNLAKHTTRHNANPTTPPISFPKNAQWTKAMKEKTCKRTLAYTRAGRRTLRRHPPLLYRCNVFSHTLQTKNNIVKKHARLRQGQVMGLSAHRPTVHLATHWGWYTAAPNAIKTA